MEAQVVSNKSVADCIYLDNAANTKVDPGVLNTIYSVLSKDGYGNAHAKHHLYGAASAQVVQTAREKIATCIDADPAEIIFTSGATESNNLVIKGLARYLESLGKTHVVTTAIEHKSVLGPLSYLENRGFEITTVLPSPCGVVTVEMIERSLNAHTGFVCIQAVNNEIGTIQPLAEISAMFADREILFHSDAVQALEKIPFSVAKKGVDFASLSAHKIYGPPGIGAVYIKAQRMGLLDPLHSGGGQERGLRSGTLPVALCAGFGTACSLISDHSQYLHMLRMTFMKRIESLNPVVYGCHELEWNVPGILNISFPGIDNETLVMALPGLIFGIGSACSSEGTKLSHVIQAITGSEQAAKESIRLSFGRSTTKEDIEKAADQIIATVIGIREQFGVITNENRVCR